MSLLFQQYAAQYFALEDRRKTLLRDARGLLRELRQSEPGPWLDLGCGSGEHVAVLRRAGLDVRGIDRSPEMIAVARERFADLPVKAAAIETLPDADTPRESLAGAFSLFGTFNYYQNRAALREGLAAVAAALRPGGRLLLELWQRDSYADLADRVGKDGAGVLEMPQTAGSARRIVLAAGGGELVRQRQVRLLAEAETEQGDGLPALFVEIEHRYASTGAVDTHRLRLSDPDEIAALAAEFGLQRSSPPAADLSGQPLTRASAGMLLVFRKESGQVGG